MIWRVFASRDYISLSLSTVSKGIPPCISTREANQRAIRILAVLRVQATIFDKLHLSKPSNQKIKLPLHVGLINLISIPTINDMKLFSSSAKISHIIQAGNCRLGVPGNCNVGLPDH